MPLGNVIGEFTGKIMSVRQTDLGGGQVRVELDAAGETSGQVSGQFFSTMVVEGTPGRPATYSSTGTLLAASGAVMRVFGRGVGIRTGEGHKVRCRGSGCASTDDPKLAALNTMLTAVEFEIDPATMTVKGAVCEWK
jgi:hypothetical protein